MHNFSNSAVDYWPVQGLTVLVPQSGEKSYKEVTKTIMEKVTLPFHLEPSLPCHTILPMDFRKIGGDVTSPWHFPSQKIWKKLHLTGNLYFVSFACVTLCLWQAIMTSFVKLIVKWDQISPMTIFHRTKHLHRFSSIETFSHFLSYPKYDGRRKSRESRVKKIHYQVNYRWLD